MIVPAAPASADYPSWPLLESLIGDVYESALDPSLWDDTLTRITASLGPLEWDLAFLIWERSLPAKARFVGSTGLAAWVPEIYGTVYAANNPWSGRHSATTAPRLRDDAAGVSLWPSEGVGDLGPFDKATNRPKIAEN